MVRHKIGIEHWVSTQRPDRTDNQDIDRDKLLQGALVNHACEADAQALINISRKKIVRMCRHTNEAGMESSKRKGCRDGTRTCQLHGERVYLPWILPGNVFLRIL